MQKRIEREKKNGPKFYYLSIQKCKKVPVSRELIRVGFSIDFAVVSVPLGYQKIPPTKISIRIQW